MAWFSGSGMNVSRMVDQISIFNVGVPKPGRAIATSGGVSPKHFSGIMPVW